MSILDYDALRADIIQYIKDNPDEEITGQIEQDRLLNIVDSAINIKTGGLVMRARLGQFVYIAPTDDREFVTKKYVDSAVSGPSQVTNSATIALLTNNSNWTNNEYTGTAITGQSAGDWYISNGIDYKFYTNSGLKVRRIPYSLL